jgi:beta-xylosidase
MAPPGEPRFASPYLFSTGDPAGSIGSGNIQIRTSSNLRDWSYAGTVFATKPAWITAALGNIPNRWAPDISYFGGLRHLYYAGSSFGSNNSVIGLATTPTLDPHSSRYHWTDDGLVFRTTSADNFNAIDPSLVTAAGGGRWLVLGSYWSGIKLIQLDAATGKPVASPAGFAFTSGASDWLVYHYYDAFDNGAAWIQIRPLSWVGGWPVTGQAMIPVPGQAGPQNS